MIDGVVTKPLEKHVDGRGWLAELYRDDESANLSRPAMAYISVTHGGVVRGPHEHIHQTDCFCFVGPSNFLLYLWDNREDSPSYSARMTLTVGQDNPMMVVIPPGVVHGYKNITSEPGTVINFPDKLFMGPGRDEPVDEIRHESDAGSPFRID